MRLSLVFLLAWSCAFFGQSHQASRDLGLELRLKELASIKETLDQHTDKLRVLETNLDLVLSKVLFLAEQEGRSSREDLLEKVLAKFKEEERPTAILQRIEGFLMACGRGVSEPPKTPRVKLTKRCYPTSNLPYQWTSTRPTNPIAMNWMRSSALVAFIDF
ncbi:uncharacterized protein [Drosophila bipectinata]|uniref:uncharacterized protein isoform X2 n=1 Tax=Drosophila bipectinata TaxID=42026 RepID=UPI0038B36D95